MMTNRLKRAIRLSIAAVVLLGTIVGGWIGRRRIAKHAGDQLLDDLVRINDVEGVAWAIECGAWVEGLPRPGQGGFGYVATPLYTAAYHEDGECARLLLDAGASPDGMASEGKAMWHTPLHVAVRERNEGLVRLLIERGADVNIIAQLGYDGETPLHCAADEGHAGCVRLLVEAGADLRAKGLSRWGTSDLTPLHIAVSSGNVECIRIIVEAGAEINAKDTFGRTPLDYSRNEESRKLLLKHRAVKGNSEKQIEAYLEEMEKQLPIQID